MTLVYIYHIQGAGMHAASRRAACHSAGTCQSGVRLSAAMLHDALACEVEPFGSTAQILPRGRCSSQLCPTVAPPLPVYNLLLLRLGLHTSGY